MHWPGAVFNLFLCAKPGNNCRHYQWKEKKRKISRVVSLWNIKELNLKECSLIITSKFSKCLYPFLSEPGFFCVSCLMIFRIYSNIFCFSPCICCEIPVSLRRSCLAAVQGQNSPSHCSAGNQPAECQALTGTPPANLYIGIVPVQYHQFSSDIFCKIIPRSWPENSKGVAKIRSLSAYLSLKHMEIKTETCSPAALYNDGVCRVQCWSSWNWHLLCHVGKQLREDLLLKISCKEMKLSFEPVCFISSQFSYVGSLP